MSFLDKFEGFEDSDSDSESQERYQSPFNLEPLFDSLMATQQRAERVRVGNPIHPNPLERYFKAEPTDEETDTYEEVPVADKPSQEHQDLVELTTRYNTLKRDRTNIYSSITRMTNNINKVMRNRTLEDWNALLTRAGEAKQALWDITQELNKLKPTTMKAENMKSLQYQQKIETTIGKITSHIRAMIMGIDECVAETTAALEPEQPLGGAAGLTAQSQEETQARIAAAAAAATTPQVGGEIGGAGPAEPITLATLANLLGSVLKRDPPPSTTTADKPVKDYRGLKPIEIPSFSGDTLEYHYFKKAFHAAHDYRNLDKTTLALLLQSHLKGPAGRLAQNKLKTNIDETTYDIIWEALDSRYGGDYNETTAISEQFNKLPVLTSFDFKDLERTYNSFELQKNYYEKYDSAALKNSKSMLNTQAKQKFNIEVGGEYVRWCEDKEKVGNFNTLVEWLHLRYETALKTYREYNHLNGEKTRDGKPRVNFSDQTDEYDHEEDEEEEEEGQNPDLTLFTQTPGGKFQRFDPSKTFRGFSKPGGFGKFQSFKKPMRTPLQLKPTDTCVLCKTTHEMSKCLKFKELPMEEKMLIMRSSVLCFHCLSSKHFVRDCQFQEGKLCGVRNCKQYHHPLLHVDRPQVNFEYDPRQFEPLSEDEQNLISHLIENDRPFMAHVAGNGAISLQTIVCNVAVKDGNLQTVALLDTGSTMTAIDEDFALKHKFRVLRQREGQEVYTVDRLVKFKGIQYLVEVLVSSSENDIVTKIEAWTVKDLVQNCGIVDWKEKKKNFPHLKKVRFPTLPQDPRITILFGINTTRMFRSTHTVANPNNPEDPVAIKTLLGWTCIGRSSNPEQLTVDPTPQLNSMLFKAHSEK